MVLHSASMHSICCTCLVGLSEMLMNSTDATASGQLRAQTCLSINLEVKIHVTEKTQSIVF